MAFTIQLGEYSDMEQALLVEQAAMPHYTYLQSAWHYYQTTPGRLVCALQGDTMVGIGRFSVLPDGSGWLECLRVMPQYQGQGAGKQIYGEWLRLAEGYRCPSIAMYTNTGNRRSAGLAGRFGLTTTATHRGYGINTPKGVAYSGDFAPVDWQQACRLLLPLGQAYGSYFCLNRTFYRVNQANICHFADRGFVYHEPSSGSTVMCGARFCKGAGLHIAAMDGAYDRCIDFALHLAEAMGQPRVTCTLCGDNPAVQQALRRRGFVPEQMELITKELVF